MSLPPLWKVRRELWRVKEQVQGSIQRRLADPLRRAMYERNLQKTLQETPGRLPLTPRVAVFVLFQSKGIPGSIFFTLDHLAREGWSVLIVSNAQLTDTDRARLAEKSAHLIERPNIGYDFGAYREGWRWLANRGQPLDRLILMNDSTWFPLRVEDDSLRRMEALDVDLAGHIFKTELAEDNKHDHIESHLLMMSRKALAHPTIRAFWNHYLMTDSKALTIQHGEKGITHAARRAGLKVQGLLSRERLVSLMAAQSDEALLDTLRNLSMHNDTGDRQLAAWLAAAADGKPWREIFFAWVEHELLNSRQHLLSATFIDPAVSLGGMGFLKKSGDKRFHLARLTLMNSISARRIAPLDQSMTSEIEACIRSWLPPHDWRGRP